MARYYNGTVKKKRKIGWHIEQKLDDAAMWHKKQIRTGTEKNLIFTDYKLLCYLVAKGLIIGAILL